MGDHGPNDPARAEVDRALAEMRELADAMRSSALKMSGQVDAAVSASGTLGKSVEEVRAIAERALADVLAMQGFALRGGNVNVPRIDLPLVTSLPPEEAASLRVVAHTVQRQPTKREFRWAVFLQSAVLLIASLLNYLAHSK